MWWGVDVTPEFEAGPMIGALIIGYLLGSIPFGLLFTQAAGLGDIRQIGSGNIGATNVLRTGHKGLALATLLADVGKAALATILAGMAAGPLPSILAGCAAFIGHIYPVWLGLKGGKGVATYFGMLIALVWPAGLLAAATWAGIAWIFRYSSLAALVAAVAAPVYFALFGYLWFAAVVAVLTLIIFWRHRDNIRRLIAGKETKIGAKAEAPPAAPTVQT